MRKLIATVTCCTALVWAPLALGGGSSTSRDAYSTASKRMQAALTAAPRVQAASSSGQLPMTGMDLSVIGLAGVGLAGMGFALRRLAGRQERD